MAGFRDRLDDPTVGFLAEPAGPPVTLVAFAGIRGGLGIAPFEFFRVTEGLGVRRILVRDLDQVWYLRGIRGLGASLPEAAARLRAEIGEGARVVLTGNSAGGFAAIAFGAIIGADEVHAFSPQTAIDRRHRVRWLDGRWLRQMHHVRRLGPPHELMDLRRVLRDRGGPRVHIHYCDDHGRDARHARHLEGLPGVTLVPHRGDGHRLVTDLRDRGDLARILADAVA
ncbi:MAG TPA: hypothetical protein VE032_01135 [Actinomycetota bacterium]|nr:hypothetical protein [Actinomycetota bacterium]